MNDCYYLRRGLHPPTTTTEKYEGLKIITFTSQQNLFHMGEILTVEKNCQMAEKNFNCYNQCINTGIKKNSHGIPETPKYDPKYPKQGQVSQVSPTKGI